jgi:hypothetical protein
MGLFETRPIYHKLDETICGHTSCSFLALVLKMELEDRITALGDRAPDGSTTQAASAPDIIADLDSLGETKVEQDGERFMLRCSPRPSASLALRATGVALPKTVRQFPGACPGLPSRNVARQRSTRADFWRLLNDLKSRVSEMSAGVHPWRLAILDCSPAQTLR